MKPFNKRLLLVAKTFEPIWYILSFFANTASSCAIKKILIFDFHNIGDIVMLTPLLERVRLAYPEAKISLVAGAWAVDILEALDLVDEIITFKAPWVKSQGLFLGIFNCYRLLKNLRKNHWDLGIEVRGDIRQIFLMFLTGASTRVGFDMMGGRALLTHPVEYDQRLIHLTDYHKRICESLSIWNSNDTYKPKLHLSEIEKKSIKNIPLYIGVHLGASSSARRLQISKARTIVERLLKKYNGKKIVIFYLIEDEAYFEELFAHARSLVGNQFISWRGTLREFIVYLCKCEIFYCLDSGPSHIAAALGVKTKVIYGPSDFNVTKAIGEDVVILNGNNPKCWPCGNKTCHSEEYQSCYSIDMI